MLAEVVCTSERFEKGVALRAGQRGKGVGPVFVGDGSLRHVQDVLVPARELRHQDQEEETRHHT